MKRDVILWLLAIAVLTIVITVLRGQAPWSGPDAGNPARVPGIRPPTGHGRHHPTADRDVLPDADDDLLRPGAAADRDLPAGPGFLRPGAGSRGEAGQRQHHTQATAGPDIPAPRDAVLGSEHETDF